MPTLPSRPVVVPNVPSEASQAPPSRADVLARTRAALARSIAPAEPDAADTPGSRAHVVRCTVAAHG